MAIVNNIFSTPTIGKSRPSDANTVGTVNPTPGGISVEEFGKEGMLRRTVVTLTAVPVTLIDATVQGGGVLLYTFPEGVIEIVGAVCTGPVCTTTSVLADTLNTGVTLTWGLGTVIQNATPLATTEIDICPGSGITPGAAVASTTINVAGTATGGFRSATTKATFNGSTTPIKAHLNIGVPTGADIDANATITVTCQVEFTWMNHGDVT